MKKKKNKQKRNRDQGMERTIHEKKKEMSSLSTSSLTLQTQLYDNNVVS